MFPKFLNPSIFTPLNPVLHLFAGISIYEGLVKSLQGRHSRECGSPELIDFLGFPRSRE